MCSSMAYRWPAPPISKTSLWSVMPGFRASSDTGFYGRIDGAPYCLAAVMRDGIVRAISLRRAHSMEFNRHVH